MKLAQLKEAKEKVYREVAGYVLAHPEETLPDIAERFGMSYSTVSRIAARAGLAPRRPGRKPGISPARVQHGNF